MVRTDLREGEANLLGKASAVHPRKRTLPLDNPAHSGFVKWRNAKKTYNIRDSLVVTDPTTDLTLRNLIKGERTGSHVFSWIWSYVGVEC